MMWEKKILIKVYGPTYRNGLENKTESRSLN